MWFALQGKLLINPSFDSQRLHALDTGTGGTKGRLREQSCSFFCGYAGARWLSWLSHNNIYGGYSALSALIYDG